MSSKDTTCWNTIFLLNSQALRIWKFWLWKLVHFLFLLEAHSGGLDVEVKEGMLELDPFPLEGDL
jgi:hypothetical protein